MIDFEELVDVNDLVNREITWEEEESRWGPGVKDFWPTSAQGIAILEGRMGRKAEDCDGQAVIKRRLLEIVYGLGPKVATLCLGWGWPRGWRSGSATAHAWVLVWDEPGGVEAARDGADPLVLDNGFITNKVVRLSSLARRLQAEVAFSAAGAWPLFAL